jgi:hypothetical protein
MIVKARISKKMVINYLKVQIPKKEQETKDIILERAIFYAEIFNKEINKENKINERISWLGKIFGKKSNPKPLLKIENCLEERNLFWDYIENLCSYDDVKKDGIYSNKLTKITNWLIFARKTLNLCDNTHDTVIEFDQDSWNTLML